MAAVFSAAAAVTAPGSPRARLFLLQKHSPSPSFPVRSPAAGSLRLGLSSLRRPPGSLRPRAAISPPPPCSLVFESTRTLASLFAFAVSVSKGFLSFFHRVAARASAASPEEIDQLRFLQGNLTWAVGPLFFAARRVARPSGYLNTPLTVVAAGMAKWLDIYSGVLMVRVLLSWFPNIPWDRQPLSAIRDLCDPYLNLFRNIIPPVFDTLDVSPLLAFAVLGTLGSILNSSRMMKY
ncbi:ylmG homolog protein 1-2, chloroplastic-like isoform X1 [Curcuma longa]|uniref:ylmG homolog protein 1-2, chloroplastic-like isoform X1 n=1 Tax=Curcuma longa TaxID=136217 RepID=UPI003D9E54B0